MWKVDGRKFARLYCFLIVFLLYPWAPSFTVKYKKQHSGQKLMQRKEQRCVDGNVSPSWLSCFLFLLLLLIYFIIVIFVLQIRVLLNAPLLHGLPHLPHRLRPHGKVSNVNQTTYFAFCWCSQATSIAIGVIIIIHQRTWTSAGV